MSLPAIMALFNMEKPHSLYVPHARSITKSEIVYQEEMYALMVDIPKTDIPTHCMNTAPQFVQDIFDLVLHTHRVMKCKDLTTDVFLIQKTSLVPCQVESNSLVNGYMLLALFPQREFLEHFPIIAKSAIAINNGYLGYTDALDLSFEDLGKKLEAFNASHGIAKTGSRYVKNIFTIGKMATIDHLDHSLEIYHFMGRDVLPQHLRGKDLSDAWMRRAMLLTPQYLYETSARSRKTYRDLFRLAQLIRKAEQPTTEERITYQMVMAQDRYLGDHPLKDLFLKHTQRCRWGDMMSGNIEGKSVLDLSGMTAWKVQDIHLHNPKHFYETKLYTLPRDDTFYDDTDLRTIDFDDDGEWGRISEFTMTNAYNPIPEKNFDEELPLYPALQQLKSLFKAVSEEIGDSAVCRIYQDPNTTSFLLESYRDFMMGGRLPMSAARTVQYKVLKHIMTKHYVAGCLNAGKDKNDRHQLVCATRFSDVEPHQDIFASQLINMAATTGVCHLSNELYLFLLGNIIGFTTKEQKPIMVLDGPPGAGKSYTAKVHQMIVNGAGSTRNMYACSDEHYTTTRSHTVSPLNPYENVLGQRFIEEWRSGDGTNNPYMKNVSLESTTMKTMYDTGRSVNERCHKVKMPNGMEQIKKGKDIALDDRSAIILANGFKTCSSIKNRCIIFHIPDLTAKVGITDNKSLQNALSCEHIPEFFALMRYFISEEFNRQELDMTLKYDDSDPEIDHNEVHLTFERIQEVMDNMGLMTREILTQRRKLQILNFAQVMALWRAVCEVYGYMHKDKVHQPTGEESLSEFNERAIEEMVEHLKSLSEMQRVRLVAARYVLDPSDILSALTLTVQLTEPDRQLMKVICLHLVNPSCFEAEQPWGENYMTIENINISIICDKLKFHHMKVLDESLGNLLTKLEDKYVKDRVPCVVRKMETGGINKTKEKMYQLFHLLVNAEYAVKIYAQEQSDTIWKCVELVRDHLVDIFEGRAQCDWSTRPNWNLCHTGYLRVDIPSQLKKAFDFLYHVPSKRKIVDTNNAQKSNNGYTTEVDPDFGQGRIRAVQQLVVNKLREEPGMDISENGYVQIAVANTELCSQRCSTSVEDMCEGWESRPILVTRRGGNWHVHIQIFSSKFDDDENVTMWRKIVMEQIDRGVFARKGYFIIPTSLVQNPLEINRVVTMSTSENVPIFGRDRDRSTLSIHISVLSEMSRLEGIMEEKSNMTRTLVEKCLCENMTDFSTVMVFDRETVYGTQNVHDSISFINVQDTTFRRHNGTLPTFKCDNITRQRKEDGLNTLIRNVTRHTTEDGKYLTFHPRHRERKLAIKDMMIKTDIVRDMKMKQKGKVRALIEELAKDIEDDIQTRIKEVNNMYQPLKKVPDLQPCEQYVERGQNTSSKQAGGALSTHCGLGLSGKRKRNDENEDSANLARVSDKKKNKVIPFTQKKI